MTFTLRRAIALLALVGVTRIAVSAQAVATPAAPQATPDMIGRIFSGEFSPGLPPPPQWHGSRHEYLTSEPAGGGNEIVRREAGSGRRNVLITPAQLTPPGAASPLDPEALEWSADASRVLIFTNSRRVWRTNSRGDYWLLDRRTNRLSKLGGDAAPSSLMYAKFDPQANRVAYVRQNDIYVEDLASHAITRVTTDGSPLVVNGGSDWVNEEELDLHDCFRWSPDGRRIAFWQFDLHQVGNFSLQYNLGEEKEIVTQIPYPETGPYPVRLDVPYPLAGTTNSAVRVGVVDAAAGPVTWMALEGDAREHYVARLQWVDSGTLLIQRLNRLQNTDDFLLADAAAGNTRLLWRDRDESFISIGFGGLPEAKPTGGGAAFLAMSEKDGWMHVWRIGRDGRETLVTRGAMDVVSISGIDEAAGILYFLASPDDATQSYLYRARLDGTTDPVRVTPREFSGTNTYFVSPDGRFAAHRFSSFDDPGIAEVVSLPDHKPVQRLGDTSTLKEAIAPLLDPPVERFKVDAGNGVSVDGYMIKPRDLDRSKRYPVLVFIYGEPAGQTVADTWGGNTTLFHRYLASLGYLVVSFDNAGTPAPRGRDWRKAVYGSVGVLSSAQQAAALRSLARRSAFVDLDRVAVWGWSGGGTNTLNLMFRHPDLYKVGMAVAPVPDQRLYDSIYQERYMGLPQQNVDGYKRGSAINFADGLKGDLLIVHGSGDDNVHYQGTELLVNRLIELGKAFDFMTYPARTHAISEGPGTSVHIYRLLARYLTEHLPAGPR
jgi:dipeptidyl-peptidase-4